MWHCDTSTLQKGQKLLLFQSVEFEMLLIMHKVLSSQKGKCKTVLLSWISPSLLISPIYEVNEEEFCLHFLQDSFSLLVLHHFCCLIFCWSSAFTFHSFPLCPSIQSIVSPSLRPAPLWIHPWLFPHVHWLWNRSFSERDSLRFSSPLIPSSPDWSQRQWLRNPLVCLWPIFSLLQAGFRINIITVVFVVTIAEKV